MCVVLAVPEALHLCVHVFFDACVHVSVCLCICVPVCPANAPTDGSAPGCPLLPPPSPWLPERGVLCHGGLLVSECVLPSADAGCVHPLPLLTFSISTI